MNLHEIKIRGVQWTGPHVAQRDRLTCSDCGTLQPHTSGRSHLERVHRMYVTWYCECRDHGRHDCGNIMNSADANIDDTNGRDPYHGAPLDPDFPFIYVCPDCRNANHDHRRRERNQP